MMRILDVRPAGLRVVMEFDLQDLEQLASALECAQFVPNRSSAEQGPAATYVKDKFYPELKEFLASVKHGS
jgi:hypothetical protein